MRQLKAPNLTGGYMINGIPEIRIGTLVLSEKAVIKFKYKVTAGFIT